MHRTPAGPHHHRAIGREGRRRGAVAVAPHRQRDALAPGVCTGQCATWLLVSQVVMPQLPTSSAAYMCSSPSTRRPSEPAGRPTPHVVSCSVPSGRLRPASAAVSCARRSHCGPSHAASQSHVPPAQCPLSEQSRPPVHAACRWRRRRRRRRRQRRQRRRRRRRHAAADNARSAPGLYTGELEVGFEVALAAVGHVSHARQGQVVIRPSGFSRRGREFQWARTVALHCFHVSSPWNGFPTASAARRIPAWWWQVLTGGLFLSS
jgi:hypothetical protein